MKPLNADDPGCNYTSSNCVVWEGPDIPCIKLCKGDTVSDVVFKLATLLCELKDQTSVSAYAEEIACFNIQTLPPQDFEDLMKFILDTLCTLVNASPVAPVNQAPGCPDCTVPTSQPFHYENSIGDTVTSMQLADYTQAIGNQVAENMQTLDQHQTTLNNHTDRIDTLEHTPPPAYVPPTITPACVLPAVPTEMDQVLTALELQFCELVAATGTPAALYENISKQCLGLNTEKTLSGTGGTMSAIAGWAPAVTTLAQAFGNMWLTLCDMRQAITNIQLTCCPSGCDGITLNLFASLSGDILTVYPTGTIPAGFLQCSGNTQFTVTDSNGGSATFSFDLIGFLNNATGYSVNLTGTPVNISLDLNVDMTPCLTNASTNATCKSCLSYYIVNTANCPVMSFTTGSGSIVYSFTSNTGDFTYNVQLWDHVGGTMLANNIHIVSGVTTVNGQFIGLSPNTVYKIRMVITATACPACDPVQCQFNNVTTNPLPCPPPTGVSAGITIP